jgi:oligopeptidase B
VANGYGKDGTQIPISIVYKQGIEKDGKNPLFMTGYGSYGYSYPVMFSSTRLTLLDRGIVYAIAHIRGGEEMGRKWYEDGKFLQKKNTFTDFIACAEYLIDEKWTASDRLVISGGSAGGLLMGAVINMRPELFKVVVADVPFVDVVTTI